MNYYDIKTHVSNSDLNALRKAINVTEDMPDLQKHYAFGNLVDASVTETFRIQGNTLDVESGGFISFEDEQIKKAERMAAAYHADPHLKRIFEGAKTQYAFYRNQFPVEWEGYEFTLPVKCKFDLYRKGVVGGDIKSTACYTRPAFLESIDRFNYDQQGALYLDISGLDRFMIIGLSKKAFRGAHQVFKHLIERGDDLYNSGKRKYSRLAYKHHIYFSNFNL